MSKLKLSGKLNCHQFSVVYNIAVFTIGMENLFSKREDVNIEKG